MSPRFLVGVPAPTEYAPFQAGYVARVAEADLLAVLEAQLGELRALARSLDPSRERFAYAPGRWTVRDVLGHVVDTERVFAYRTFCISRGDTSRFPSFDQDPYVAAGRHGDLSVQEHVEQFARQRTVSLDVLRRLDAAAWHRVGTAADAAVSVRGTGYVMAGHVRHHQAILRERYGVAAASGL